MEWADPVAFNTRDEQWLIEGDTLYLWCFTDGILNRIKEGVTIHNLLPGLNIKWSTSSEVEAMVRGKVLFTLSNNQGYNLTSFSEADSDLPTQDTATK